MPFRISNGAGRMERTSKAVENFDTGGGSLAAPEFSSQHPGLSIMKPLMMTPENQNIIYLLFGAVGLLLFILMGVLTVSQLRRRPPPAVESLPAEAKPETAAKTPEAPAAVPEEDVDLKKALRNTEQNFFGRMRSIFQSKGVTSAALEDVEEVLYTSDLGPKTVQSLLSSLQSELSKNHLGDSEAVRGALKTKILSILETAPNPSAAAPILPLQRAPQGPTVLMIVGVNGAGKTTSIGKIAARFASEGLRVLVAAGDTFRAAAGAQLKVWSDRAQVEIFSPEGVTDPAAVAFDAVSKATAQGYDVVLIDTAGRLHTQGNLMEELKKVRRVIQKVNEQAPHETLIVLDANSGQNALIQAKEFNKAVPLTGAILTKMDGTAKGGVAVGLVDELAIPVKMIGVGERIRDLRPFSAKEYVDSILG